MGGATRCACRAIGWEEDGDLVGRCARVSCLRWLAKLRAKAGAGSVRLVEDTLKDLAPDEAPEPLAIRQYGGWVAGGGRGWSVACEERRSLAASPPPVARERSAPLAAVAAGLWLALQLGMGCRPASSESASNASPAAELEPGSVADCVARPELAALPTGVAVDLCHCLFTAEATPRPGCDALRELHAADAEPSLRPELLAWAKLRARAPLDACRSERVVGWRVLLALGELEPGTSRARAVELLGPPTQRDGAWLLWYGTANPCHVIRTLRLELDADERLRSVELR